MKRGQPNRYPHPVSTTGPLAISPQTPVMGFVERVVRTPVLFCSATLMITVAGLALDSRADLAAQLFLGLCTWGFLAIAFAYLTPMERAQTSVVVMVATCAEIIGSVIWGVYVYRLGNLPLFVPPGHGLVYLTGLRVSQMPWFRLRPRLLIGLAIAAVSAWALIGLLALDRTDVAGAIGASVLLLFLVRGRAPAVYAGVFFAVAFLEIYGTWIGTWQWAAEIPHVGIPDGNPPSGAASGYVFFDISALALSPFLLEGWARIRHRIAPTAAGRPGPSREPGPPPRLERGQRARHHPGVGDRVERVPHDQGAPDR